MKIIPIRHGIKRRTILSCAFLMLWSFVAQAQTYYPRVTSSGNWSAGASWSTSSCIGAAANAIPSTVAHTVSMSCSGKTITTTTAATAGPLIISNGTLVVSSPLTVSSLTMTGGTLNITGTLNVSGAVSITGGTITGTGTLGLTGGAQTIAVNQAIPNLNVAGSGNKTMSGNLTITDELILTSNNLIVGSNLLTVSSAAAGGSGISRSNGKLTLAATSSLSLGGTWVNNDISPLLSNSFPLTIANFTMTRNTCELGLGSNHNLTVNGAFTLSAGKFSIGSSLLTLNGAISGNINGSITGGGNSDLTIGGSGAASMYFNLATFGQVNGSNTIRNFTNNRVGTPFSMLSSLRIGGTLTQASSASLQISSGSFQSLTIDGSVSGTTNLIGNSAASLEINGNGSLGGTINFSSNPVLSTLTMNRLSGTAAFSSAFSTSGMSLKWGVIENANPITITGTAANNVQQIVASSYVKGILLRTIASGSTNQTYFWPVGKSASQKLTLNNVSTTSGAAVVIGVEAFDGDSNGTIDATLETLKQDHYWNTWAASNSANLTSPGTVSLSDNGLTTGDVVGYATTQNGIYTSLGGSVASGAVTSTEDAPALGYFNIGTGGSVCTSPTLPVVQASVAAICGSGSSVLSIASGSLNSATNWFWYAGSCGGTLVGSGTSVSVNPSATTTYYVRGEGGCVENGSCTSITVTVLTPQTYYADSDGDGFGNAAQSQVSCSGALSGYVLNNTDCDDNDEFRNTTFAFYADADGDGYGNGSLVNACAVDANTPPVGYSLNNSDCDDTDATVYQTGTFYIDFDRDGFSSNETAIVCYGSSMPIGYLNAATALDCKDLVAAINPMQSEVLYNGVDDNCDGELDEGFQIKTKLLANSCGATLPAIGSLIGIQTVSSAITGYRIRATNGTQVQTIVVNVPHFTMTMFPNYAYATTYNIEIELQRYGVWLGYYGDVCVVSTPPILAEGGAATVTGAQCGQTLLKINSLIATTSIPGVTGYRFKVTNLSDPSGPNAEQIITRGLNWFTLQMLTRYNYGTTYRIEIAVKTTGDFGGYGAPCEIYSPAAPSLVNCGGTATSLTSNVAATSVSGATYYRFQVTRASDGAGTTFDRSVNYFNFSNLPASLVVPGALYYVRVAVMTTGTWSPFGDICEVTASGAAAKGVNETVASLQTQNFKATVYPNPFASSFGIELNAAGQEDVNVKVYDMLGKLLENRNIPAASMSVEKVGAQFPAGVYNVIVNQSGTVRTLRVVKRS